MSYQNPEMDKLIDAARFETDAEEVRGADVRGFISIAVDDVPRVPLYQPNLDVAMQKNITGYQYWFHRQLDFRQLGKTVRRRSRMRPVRPARIVGASARWPRCRASSAWSS